MYSSSSWPRLQQRDRQSAQCEPSASADRQYRWPACHLSSAPRHSAHFRHRSHRAALFQVAANIWRCIRVRPRCGRSDRCRRARQDCHPYRPCRRCLGRGWSHFRSSCLAQSVPTQRRKRRARGSDAPVRPTDRNADRGKRAI